VRLSKLMVKSAGCPAIAAQAAMLVVEDCYVSGGRCGIEVLGGGDVTLRRSVVCRSRCHGVSIGARSRLVVESCSIFENSEHGICAEQGQADVFVTRSRVSYNGGVGVYLDGAAGGQVSINDNDLRNNAKGSVHVAPVCQGSVTVGSNLT